MHYYLLGCNEVCLFYLWVSDIPFKCFSIWSIKDRSPNAESRTALLATLISFEKVILSKEKISMPRSVKLWLWFGSLEDTVSVSHFILLESIVVESSHSLVFNLFVMNNSVAFSFYYFLGENMANFFFFLLMNQSPFWFLRIQILLYPSCVLFIFRLFLIASCCDLRSYH